LRHNYLPNLLKLFIKSFTICVILLAGAGSSTPGYLKNCDMYGISDAGGVRGGAYVCTE